MNIEAQTFNLTYQNTNQILKDVGSELLEISRACGADMESRACVMNVQVLSDKLFFESFDLKDKEIFAPQAVSA